jgi:polar amino acid transport system ATP-binding protein
MAILEVKNIEKSFGTLQVLEKIDFSLEKGEAIAIIGSSGSGKTTLLRCLNFLEKPDNGSIIVNDKVIFDAADPATQLESEVRKKRLHFGLVFQNFNLFPQYTVLKNVTLAAELLAKENPHYKQEKRAILKEIQDRGKMLLSQVGLSDKLDYYPHQISGGQQQRVAIARALALEPDILCFDEPTSALDPELTGEVLKVIRNLADRNTTMIIVTHEMDFARDVADRIIFMDCGVIVEQGSPQEVFDNPSEERTKQFLTRYKESGSVSNSR